MMNRKTALTIVAGSFIALAQGALAENSPANPVLNDAAQKTSLAGEMAGYDGSAFFVGDGTKSNRIEFHGTAQFRYNMNFNNLPSGATGEEFTHGFQTRRLRFEAGGNIGDPNLSFKMSAEWTDATGMFELKDAYAKYNYGNGVYARAGQYKTAGLREEHVSHYNQLAVERSVVNAIYGQGRSQGLGVMGQYDQWRFMADISDGHNTDNTTFDSTSEADIALAFRAEFLVQGTNWDQLNQFTSWSGQDTTGMVGAAIRYETGGSTGATGGVNGATDDGDAFLITIDSQWGGDGWNAFGAFIYASEDFGTSFQDMAFILQGGYFFTEQFEGFARWDGVFPDSDRSAVSDPFNTLGVGVNYYLVPKSQSSKLTAQLNYHLDATDNKTTGGLIGLPDTNLNLLDNGAEDGQFSFTVQWQTRF